MKKKIFSILFTFISTLGISQTPSWLWVKNYEVRSTASTSDAIGNTYIVGGFDQAHNFAPAPQTFSIMPGLDSLGNFVENIYIEKFDPQGNFIWAKACKGDGEGQGMSVDIDNHGNILVAGRYTGRYDFDPSADSFIVQNDFQSLFFMKLDSAGNFIWAKSIDGFINQSPTLDKIIIKHDGSDNIHIGVNTTDFKLDFNPDPIHDSIFEDYNNYGFVFAKYDSTGSLIFARHIYTTVNAAEIGLSGISIDSDSKIIISGGFNSANIDFNPDTTQNYLHYSSSGAAFVCKFDVDGIFQWIKFFQYRDYHFSVGSSGVDVGLNNSIYLTGLFSDTIDFDPNSSSVFNLVSYSNYSSPYILKLDSGGNFVWAKSIYSTDMVSISDFKYDPFSNSICLAGPFRNSADFDPDPLDSVILTVGNFQYFDAFIASYDFSGNFRFVKQLTGDPSLNSVSFDGSGNIYTTGTYYHEQIYFDSLILFPASIAQTFVVRLDASGFNEIKSQVSETNFSIFPNPCRDNLYISVESNTVVNAMIINPEGKLFHSFTFEGSNTAAINTQSLPNGIYFLKLYSENNSYMRKIIIAR